MAPSLRPGPVRVRVPATSANLGPGFDALGLALGLYDELEAEIVDGGLHVDVTGEGSDVATDDSHLVVRSMRVGFDRVGVRPAGLRLRCRNAIPHARGLGSSAAAIVAGLLLAQRLLDDGAALLDDDALLQLAATLEGHPDNVAPCLLGGLTVAWREQNVHAVRLEPDPSVRPVALIPPFEASTEQARALLPTQVPHPDAAFAAGRAALLVAAMTGAPHLLLAGTEDRLHQSYRRPAMPASAELMAEFRAAGLPAVISGAGPTVLVLARDETEVRKATEQAPFGWQAVPLAVDLDGARQLTE
jgi:homoserine kinase